MTKPKISKTKVEAAKIGLDAAAEIEDSVRRMREAAVNLDQINIGTLNKLEKLASSMAERSEQVLAGKPAVARPRRPAKGSGKRES